MLIADMRSRPSSSKNRLRGVEIESMRVAGQIVEKHRMTLELDMCLKRLARFFYRSSM